MTSPVRLPRYSLSARPLSRLLFGTRRLSAPLCLLAAAGMLALTGAGGCYSRPGPPEPIAERFSACEISIESQGHEHVIVAKVPSPGYSLEVDSTWEAYRGKHVFVTLRRPDPRFAYAQVVSELRVLTQVEARQSIAVFARVADRDAKDVEDEYREAARVDMAAAGGKR